ncbi:MAG: peptidoglycan-binding protein [Alphaproteobacteria bacterium]|nr:peptidoglycan-binding protein [Alphaproteobacteria bacterium]
MPAAWRRNPVLRPPGGGAFNAALVEGGPGTAVRPNLRSSNAATSRSAAATLDAGRVDLPILKLGSSDRAVGLLQRALSVLGAQTLRADGVFGARTDQAVRSFQEGSGLVKDGLVGARQTWPAINQALVTRHEGVARLADAMAPTRKVAESQLAEMRQLSAVLAELGNRVAPPVTTKETTVAMERQSSGEVGYTVRGGETLSDVARMFGLPVSALIAANPEVAKPYLILQGQLLVVPNPVKERTHRRPPRQLHPADPEGYLASANMNPDFVALVNGMITQLRGRVTMSG